MLSNADNMLVQGLGLHDCHSKWFEASSNRVASESTDARLGEDSVIIPTAYMPELRKLPDDVLSFERAVERVSDSYPLLVTVSRRILHYTCSLSFGGHAQPLKAC
jgi:hypothetical protein